MPRKNKRKEVTPDPFDAPIPYRRGRRGNTFAGTSVQSSQLLGGNENTESVEQVIEEVRRDLTNGKQAVKVNMKAGGQGHQFILAVHKEGDNANLLYADVNLDRLTDPKYNVPSWWDAGVHVRQVIDGVAAEMGLSTINFAAVNKNLHDHAAWSAKVDCPSNQCSHYAALLGQNYAPWST